MIDLEPRFSLQDMAVLRLLKLQLLALVLLTSSYASSSLDYRDALSKSILFFEAQRSGPLPSSQRVTWRGDSGLFDGSTSTYNVDLVGGYYDAGDNVKYTFPMAFTVTMLSWSTLEYGSYMAQAGEYDNVLEAIRWGTDFLVKSHTGPTELYIQVGNPHTDHACWERPEDMDTDRKLSKIDATHPGTEYAAEAAAALAAASAVFYQVDSAYSDILLDRAISLFDFANSYRGTCWNTCPFYCSFNGYNDELLWAAAWLYKATYWDLYLEYILKNMDKSMSTSEFSWDNKFVGVQVYFSGQNSLAKFKSQADKFFCSVLPYTAYSRVKTTPGGLLFVRSGANTQYATSASFLAAVYSDYLQAANDVSICGEYAYEPDSLLSFAVSQANYILGENPLGLSYMVGFGEYYPLQAHHRAASIVSVYEDPTPVPCGLGFGQWLYSPYPNPNLLVGAIVGGPDEWDGFVDSRPNSNQLEPATYINAPFVGLLARIHGLFQS